MVAQTNLTSKFTTLEYNGVQLRDCHTLKFEEIPVNDSSGMNLSHLKVTVRVVGYFHAQNTPQFWGTFPQKTSSSGAFPAQSSSVVYQYLHTVLLERRKRFRYLFTNQSGGDPGMNFGGPLQFNADTVYDVSPAPTELTEYGGDNAEMETIYDVAGGPEPLGLSVSEITGNNIWRVEFEITCSVRPRCFRDSEDVAISVDPDGDLTGQLAAAAARTDYDHSVHRALGVLSNRWSSIDSIDQNEYLTRTTVGQVELSNPSWNPHDYRYLTLPPLHPGMRRERMNFTASTDNLKLMYEIVDQEVTASAPGNASSFSLDHTEAVNPMKPFLATFHSRCTVNGSRIASRSDLIRTAVEVIDGKILLTALNLTGVFTVFVDRFEIADHQGTDQNNMITVTLSGTRLLSEKTDPIISAKKAMSVLGFISAKRITASNITGSMLRNYNNQRSKGNRDTFIGETKNGEETPLPDGPIGALSALACALQERCTENMGMGPAMKANLEGDAPDNRAARVTSLLSDISGENADLYTTSVLWPAEILVQIADNPTYEADVQWSTDHRASIYTHHEITSRYETDSLLFGMPAADTTSSFADTNPSYPNTVMIALGLPQTRRVVRVIAQRFGRMPEMPNAPKVIEEKIPGEETVQAIGVLESKRPIYMNPIPASDGSGMLLYSAGMEFTYIYNVEPPYHRMGIAEWDSSSQLADSPANAAALAPYRFAASEIQSGNWGPTK